MVKIKCPHCVAIKPGIVFSVSEDATGIIEGKCKKCGAFITYDADLKHITKVEFIEHQR